MRRLAWTPPWIAVLLRLALWPRVAASPETWMGDAKNYLEIAQGLVQLTIHPDAWIWPPGYSLLGAALAPFAPGYGLLILSIASGILLAAAPVWVGLRTGVPLTGFLAGLILAVHPDLVIHSLQPLSDSPSLALLVGSTMLGGLAAYRRSGWQFALAGLVGGLAILTRPENAAAIVGLGAAFLLARGSRLLAPAFLISAALVVLPYALAFHEATDTWGLTLKSHVNILRSEVYQSASTYVERRMQWDARFERFVPDGLLDARALANAVDPFAWMTSGAATSAWWANVSHALTTGAVLPRVLTLVGLAGLVLLRGPGVRVRRLAMLISIPILTVPLFVPPYGRFALVLLPAVAWGLGGLGETLYRWVAPRSRRAAFVLVAGTATAWTLLATVDAWSRTQDFAWRSREPELRVAVAQEDWKRVERIATDGMKLAPGDFRFPHTLGTVSRIRGDSELAEHFFRQAVRLGADPSSLDARISRENRQPSREPEDPTRGN